MAHRFQFFVGVAVTPGDEVALTEGDAHHLRTVRASSGTIVDVVDGSGTRFEAEVVDVAAGAVRVVREAPSTNAVPGSAVVEGSGAGPTCAVHVYVGALQSGQRFDALVDECVQAGVDAITMMVTSTREREIAEKRVARGARVAEAAAKQAKRLAVPTVHAPIGRADVPRSPAGVVLDLRASESLVACDLSPIIAASLQQATPTIPIVVGGAEGLPEAFIDELIAAGWCAASLGHSVLRAGLAAAVATSIVTQRLAVTTR